MSYIAKTDGGQTVLELRTGSLTSISENDRSNWRAVTVVQPEFDGISQMRGTQYFEVSQDGNTVSMKWNIEDIDPVLLKHKLKEYAASVRWQKQVAGIILEDGTKILTDAESQSKIHQVYSILKEGWVEEINFKSPDGWITLDLTTATSIAQLVFGHIQNCFNTEKDIIAAIDAGTVTTGAQILSWEW